MSKTAMTLLLLLMIATSKAQLVTYSFPENEDIAVCPAIIPSSSVPSFGLQPSSETANDLFLIGTYDEPTNVGIPEAQFDRENSPCTNDNSPLLCSKLSLLYGGDARVGRGSFVITYTASNSIERRIRVNFGYAGLYLDNETAGPVLGRDPTNLIFLNNSLVVFGAISKLVFCYENAMAVPNNLWLSVPTPFSDDECSRNDQANSQPGRFKIRIEMNVTGQERAYFADGNCSSTRRSETFLVIFDPPTSTEDPGPTTTEPTTSIEPSPSPPMLAIGLGVGVPFLVILGVLLVSLLIGCLCYDHKKKHQSIECVEKGSTGNRSKTSSVSTVDGHEGPSSSPTLLITSKSNGHIQQKIPRKPKKKKLRVVKYKNSKTMNTIEETLVELNEDSYELAATQQNGILPTNMTNFIEAGNRVIILHGRKESSSLSDDISTRWIKELETCPKFTKKQLDNVFVVYLGCNQPPSALQKIPVLRRIAISQHPDDEDSNFDPVAIAKMIQEEIVNMSPLIQQHELSVPPNLPTHHPASLTGSRTPAQSTPLVTRNPGAGAEHPGEHPSASSAEPSQLSLTTEYDGTGQAVVSNTIETVPGSKLEFLDKVTDSKMLNSTSSTPATSRNQGRDDLESSPSAPSVIQVEKVELENMINKAVEAQGVKTRQEIRKAEKGIKDKVEEQGDRLADGIEVVADGIERARSEMQNQNFDVDQPYDIDDGGKDLGSADTV